MRQVILLGLGLAVFAFAAGCERDASPREAVAASAPKKWNCSEQPFCSQIATCEEAQYRLHVCGLTRLDANGDGEACELTCTGPRPPRPANTLAKEKYTDLPENPYWVEVEEAAEHEGVEVTERDHLGRPVSLSFYGRPCEHDCAGHLAGYYWADENDIADPAQCRGWSQSFIEGCEARAEGNY